MFYIKENLNDTTSISVEITTKTYTATARSAVQKCRLI